MVAFIDQEKAMYGVEPICRVGRLPCIAGRPAMPITPACTVSEATASAVTAQP